MTRREELENEGWTRQFTAGEPRLSEAVTEYRDMGFEVVLEPVDPADLNEECSGCFMAACDHYKVIYTRRRQ